METAFSILKNSLRSAAQAAGAALEDLIVIPDQAQDIITMFPSALSLEQINGNENFVQTRSSDVFRLDCSKLRLELLKIAKDLPEEYRIINLAKWGQDATDIWTAVQENDDLVMIRDLNHINDHRMLIVSLEQFRKIMGKAAPTGDEPIRQLSNPLL